MNRESFLILILLSLLLLLTGCASEKDINKAYILTSLSPEHAEMLAGAVGAPGEIYDFKIEIINIDDPEQYYDSLKSVLTNTVTGPVVALVPPDKAQLLVNQSLILQLSNFVDEGVLKDDLASFTGESIKQGIVEGKLYCYPYYISTILTFYHRDRVRDAVELYRRHYARMDSILKMENFEGFPVDYNLEINPSEWDYFDIFTAGYFWAHDSVSQKPHPGVAHYGGFNSYLIRDFSVRNFCLGAKPSDLLNINHRHSIEQLRWESLFFKYGIYNRAFEDSSWGRYDLAERFINGDVYYCQLDVTDLYSRLPEDIPDKYDIHPAVIPRAVSLNIKFNGHPERIGYRFSILDGFMLAVPANSPNRELSFKIIQKLVSRDHQEDICRDFGCYPVRERLTSNLKEFVRPQWKLRVMETIRTQIEIGLIPEPMVGKYREDVREFYEAYREYSFRKMVTDPVDIETSLYSQNRGWGAGR
ncbi:MAG: extracellular solute-binding protein [candidate division Zixibacteria bacterium]|nr:extracellular solute-binding protein [candidate division Zixibacteria bacterium]